MPRCIVLERRDCVASSADYVCEWNWCRKIYLIYIRALACSLLNINFLIAWFVRLSARFIIQCRRSRRVWDDLTSQPVQVIIRAALFCNFSSLWQRLAPIFSHTQHYNSQDEADSMICKLRQAESPEGKLVSISSGQQVLLAFSKTKK